MLSDNISSPSVLELPRVLSLIASHLDSLLAYEWPDRAATHLNPSSVK
jgi:hypothetical protein